MQASISMKSVMTAIWLTVSAVGNLIDVIVIKIQAATGVVTQVSQTFKIEPLPQIQQFKKLFFKMV